MRSVRSVMKSGGSLVISLPRGWAERLGVRVGEELLVEEAGSVLIISPISDWRRSSAITIRYGEGGLPMLRNKVMAAYLLGYDTIRVEAPNSVRKIVEGLLNRVKEKLLGVEIVGEELTLKVLVSHETLKPREVLARMGKISRDSVDDALAALMDDDQALAQQVVRSDEDMDRLYFYMVRMLRSCTTDPSLQAKLNLTGINILDYRLVSYLLENINDDAVILARSVGKLKPRGMEQLERIRALLRENHDEALHIFLNRSIEPLEDLREKIAEVKKLARRIPAELREPIIDIANMQHDIADLVQITL